ncbi:tudor domain-containing protein 1 isoform X5 [Takifugu rubripes]|uniref:tudor domain-containing protein 1 isoform X4 n=1 Tax=Takifugu rubripes TaxID=31033 RepID=UPI0011454447|nr:tudor domain-containing protein 1 isoform X4 [Takifugu rubripes]XP_029705369.1 tudor domain-containing protein 1 isoform X5 [Takifugu rubripes]
MDNTISPEATRPNPALRKPWLGSGSPGGPPSPPKLSAVSPVHVEDFVGNGHPSSSIKVPPAISDCSPQAIKVHYCVFCGHQGKFRCKRCKNTSYCSLECQGKDWTVHRHICIPTDQEPAKVKPLEAAISLLEERSGLLCSESGDASRQQRILMKDLPVAKVIKGTDIQAKVEEFYDPGRFFLLVHNSEVMKTLHIITTELQNTYSFQPATPYMPCVGEVCAVQYSCDMNWYRGLVQNLAAEQKMANILYIDFGNEECVPLDRIKQLATKIKPYCPCVMECRIAEVEPVGGSWSVECCMAVRQLLAGRIITVHLVDTLENGRIHAVDIHLSMGKLSTFLIAHGYATENKNVTPTEQDIHELMTASFENFKSLSDGKDDNSWAQPPEPLTQVVGETFSVVVTHLQSPSDFIVQKVENASKRVIQELQQQLRDHCFQVKAPENFRPAPGTVCCAQFSEDKQWYRAKILAYSSEERVCVGYLDFGNSEDVYIGHLRPISPLLLAIPMQTIPCGLAGVQPVGDKWSEECILALQQRVSNRILSMAIQGAHEGRALVAMIDKGSDPQENVAELLTSSGFAAPVLVTSSMNQQADLKPLAEVHVVSLCMSVPSVSSEALAWRCVELPVDGQTVSLLASVIENPQEFYCHMSNGKDIQQLLELGAALKKHCAANDSPYMPKVGEPCCAMCPDDRKWYRVMLNDISETAVSVNCVDYGRKMKLPKENLRPITASFLTLPFQAVRCSLAGVEPLGSEWNSEAKQWLWSQMDGELMTARVLSVSERGYEVKLGIRGQDMAAALISVQLAKAPGAISGTSCVNSELKHQEKMYESQPNQEQEDVQVPGQSGSISKEMPTEGPAAQSDVQLEFPYFPADWKTAELPLRETFQPCIAAIISPSLFYVLSPIQVNQQRLQAVMGELANYCGSNNSLPSLSSSSVSSRAFPGAVCCAQFSADNIWYRAVVLEGGENEVKVIYADFGNTEMVPFSRILPIPKHLLQLPFQITRCTLTGKEHFPVVWPVELQHTFQSLLSKGVLASVESFDGFANVLSLCLVTETGRLQLTSLILDALQEQAKSSQEQAKSSQCSQEQAKSSQCSQEQAKSSQEQAKRSQCSQEQAKSSQCSQEQAKSSQEQAKRSQCSQEQAKSSQCSQEQAKSSQEQAKSSQEQAKSSQCSQEQAKSSQEQAKSSQCSQEQAKSSQEQAKSSQEQAKSSQEQAKAYLSPFSQIRGQTNGSEAVVPRSPQPMLSITQKGPEEAPTSTCKTVSSEPEAGRPKLEKNTTAASGTDLRRPTCCCVSLKKQIDHLEHLAQLQLSLIKQLLQQN